MSDCPWDRGAMRGNGPPPPPPRRRSTEAEREKRERDRREKRFDPERPAEHYAKPHHFAVNPALQFETWLRKVDEYVVEHTHEEAGYLDLDERAFLDPVLGQPHWAGEAPPSACVAWGAGLTPEEYMDWLITSVRIDDDRDYEDDEEDDDEED